MSVTLRWVRSEVLVGAYGLGIVLLGVLTRPRRGATLANKRWESSQVLES